MEVKAKFQRRYVKLLVFSGPSKKLGHGENPPFSPLHRGDICDKENGYIPNSLLQEMLKGRSEVISLKMEEGRNYKLIFDDGVICWSKFELITCSNFIFLSGLEGKLKMKSNFGEEITSRNFMNFSHLLTKCNQQALTFCLQS